jgi:hypothetical protein
MEDFERLISADIPVRTRNFGNILTQNKSRGLVVLYAPKGSSILRYLYEGRVKGCFKKWNYDDSNITYVFAEDDEKDDIFMQFWELPPSAKPPDYKEFPRDYKLSDLSKPVLIDNLYKKGDHCPLYFDMKFYSQFLNANPDIDAKIVIYEKTLSAYQRERQKYLQELTEQEKIPAPRIIFVRGKYKGVSDAEFWLVPGKKK